MDGRRVYRLLFLGGVLVHLLYLCLLLRMAPADGGNWAYGDTGSYVASAEAFLETGMFARGGIPDYRRTMGYPLFVASAMWCAEATWGDWASWVYILQAFLFASVYPGLFFLGVEILGLSRRAAWSAIAFTVVSGAFISYVPVLLSDGLFATVLLTGVASGFRALQRRSLVWALAHTVLVSYAACIRPMLAFFPLAALCWHWAYLRRWGGAGDRRMHRLAAVMFLLTLIGVQNPALRNFTHHGVFTPSEIGSINLYNYLAHGVLQVHGEDRQFNEMCTTLDQMEGAEHLGNRIALRRKEALRVYGQFPGTTVGLASLHTILNSAEPHWQNVLYLFRQTWYQAYGNVHRTRLAMAVAFVWVPVQGALMLLGLIQGFRWRTRPLLILGAAFYLLPYAFCATTYQGARFRLWWEPLWVIVAAAGWRTLQTWWEHRRGRAVATGLAPAARVSVVGGGWRCSAR